MWSDSSGERLSHDAVTLRSATPAEWRPTESSFHLTFRDEIFGAYLGNFQQTNVKGIQICNETASLTNASWFIPVHC